MESNTAWAQGGIAAVLADEEREAGDTIEDHVRDTLDAGAGLCDEAAVRTIIEDAEEAIDDLVSYGVKFDREGDHFQLGKEGGHSHRRILHARDTTGREIAVSLIEAARRTPNITLLEDKVAIELITSAKLGSIIYEIVPGFLLSFLAIVVVSLMGKAPTGEVAETFDAVQAQLKGRPAPAAE